MGRKLICRARSLPSRGVSSFLFSGGNEAGLQTVTRQLDPKKGILSEGKGKGKVSTGQFPETVPVTLAHVPSSIFLGIHSEKAD